MIWIGLVVLVLLGFFVIGITALIMIDMTRASLKSTPSETYTDDDNISIDIPYYGDDDGPEIYTSIEEPVQVDIPYTPVIQDQCSLQNDCKSNEVCSGGSCVPISDF